jgi:type VI secretion system protein ImpC
MPRTSSLASVHIDVSEEAEPLPRPQPDSPFRILVAGPFGGAQRRVRKPVQVDRDNFDEVLELFAPEVALDFAGQELRAGFRELDDFHPDHLYRRLPPFQALRDLRRRVEEGAAIPNNTEAAPPANVSGADLLRNMLGESPSPAAAAPARSDWDRMLQKLVAPYAEPKPDPRKPQYLKQTDAAITGEMRKVLHHRAFQQLEAVWRSLYFLIRGLPTDENLKIYMLDLPQAEICTTEGVALLHRIAVQETVSTPGAEPWSVIAGLYYFSPAEEAVLSAIASVAARAGAPFISGVAPEVVGLSRAFDTLRHSAAARWVGLIMPRFLLRMPYGAKADAIDEFEFEEMTSPPEHECYLWANPAIAGAYLLGDAFSRYGWQMRPGVVNQIDGLPLHVYKDDGESKVKPCAEVLLTEDSMEILLDRGFMPLLSIKDTDRVRLARFQSVATPPRPLAGRWES